MTRFESGTVGPCGIRMNEKGGMNDEEFERYINNTIISLFPDMEDTLRKRVLMKVDSGPGHNCMSRLVSCKFRSLYLFPGPQNATSVQQETDRNYGLFKKVFRRNLATLATNCYAQKKPIRLSVSTFGLVIYGGVCPQTSVVCEDAVAEALSVDRNLECWALVGAVPLTMKCLSDDNAWHNGNDKNDPEYKKYQIIQSKNDYSCIQLSTMRYDADLLKTEFNEDRIRAAAEELDLSVTRAARFNVQ